MPVKWPIIKLPIISKIKVIIIPIIPATAPIINVSALNRCPTSFLRPPSDLITPISFVRSTTDTYVMIPIITVETTNDMAVKTIKEVVTTVIRVLIIEITSDKLSV